MKGEISVDMVKFHALIKIKDYEHFVRKRLKAECDPSFKIMDMQGDEFRTRVGLYRWSFTFGDKNVAELLDADIKVATEHLALGRDTNFYYLFLRGHLYRCLYFLRVLIAYASLKYHSGLCLHHLQSPCSEIGRAHV